MNLSARSEEQQKLFLAFNGRANKVFDYIHLSTRSEKLGAKKLPELVGVFEIPGLAQRGHNVHNITGVIKL